MSYTSTEFYSRLKESFEYAKLLEYRNKARSIIKDKEKHPFFDDTLTYFIEREEYEICKKLTDCIK